MIQAPPSRQSQKVRMTKSMLSTHNISFNISQLTSNKYNIDRKRIHSAKLIYAQIPMQKSTPQWNQSAATWRNTSHKYSFSKDTRFKNYKVQYSDIIQPQIPTTRSSKSCTFGKGKKKPISQIILRNAKEKPAPDRYQIKGFDQQTRKKQKGKSFGIGWKAYQKNYIDHRKDIYSPFQTENNPPAKYQVRQLPGRDKKKFSMYGRLKMYTQKLAKDKNWVPGSNYNIEDRNLYNQVGMHQRSFGFAQKIDLSMPANDYPGPKYIIPGFCKKFKNIVHKSERVSLSKSKFILNA